jgi:beta-barrel assembly-enhancing protease
MISWRLLLLLAGGALASCRTSPAIRPASPALTRVTERLPMAGATARVVAGRARNASIDADGIISVREGLLAAIERDDELAYVIAHELAHRQTRDLAKRQRSGLVQLGVTGLAGVVTSSWPTAGAAYLATALFYSLPHSRRLELAADVRAVATLAQAGYAPAAAVDFCARVLPPTSLRRDAFQWLREHPSRATRLKALRIAIKENKSPRLAKTSLERARDTH